MGEVTDAAVDEVKRGVWLPVNDLGENHQKVSGARSKSPCPDEAADRPSPEDIEGGRKGTPAGGRTSGLHPRGRYGPTSSHPCLARHLAG